VRATQGGDRVAEAPLRQRTGRVQAVHQRAGRHRHQPAFLNSSKRSASRVREHQTIDLAEHFLVDEDNPVQARFEDVVVVGLASVHALTTRTRRPEGVVPCVMWHRSSMGSASGLRSNSTSVPVFSASRSR
jgi:hypothetical protein